MSIPSFGLVQAHQSQCPENHHAYPQITAPVVGDELLEATSCSDGRIAFRGRWIQPYGDESSRLDWGRLQDSRLCSLLGVDYRPKEAMSYTVHSQALEIR